MAILLNSQNLEKSFGSHTLFSGLSFGIESGDRIGLIGPNGAGKSTLLRILAGRAEHDGGDIARMRGLTIGYLEQSPSFTPGQTVFEAVAEAAEDDPQKYAHVHEWIARLSLNQGEINEETPVEKLSGGWQKRVALARELARLPQLLLLDEPTNHLDLESILWLEEFLQSAPFAVMTITHDRMFLQRVANRIFDLDRKNPNGLLAITGSYADFLEAKEDLLAAQAKREVIVNNTLRRETEWLRRGAKARQTKQSARIERAGQLADEAEHLRSKNQNRTAQIDFQSAERHPQRLIEAKGIAKSYSQARLFGPLDLLITPKTRLGLLGPNGSGKTTLIRILLGEEKPDSGTVYQTEKLQSAYFAQYRNELDPKISVLRTLCPEGDYVDYRGQFIFARSYLDRFLFRGEQMDMPVEKLSGGEKARLRIAQLMLTKANVLVLDEPTNDLDMATLGVLEESLRDFDGAVILVTHDRYFLDQVSNEILAFTSDEKGQPSLQKFADTLQWEAWVSSRPKRSNKKSTLSAVGEEESSSSASPMTEAASSVVAKKPAKKLSFKEKFELENMEGNISKLEEKLSQLQSESARPEVVSNAAKVAEIYSEMSGLQSEIERLYARWAELEG